MATLNTLPPDIIICIYDVLPDLWSVTALRLTCKTFNAVFPRNRVHRTQRTRLIAQMTTLFEVMTENTDLLTAGPHEIQEDKTSFTLSVMQQLPYPMYGLAHDTPEDDPIDWSGKDIISETRKMIARSRAADSLWHRIPGVSLRHLVPLNYHSNILLDTMRGRIYYPAGDAVVVSRDIDDYVVEKVESLEDEDM